MGNFDSTPLVIVIEPPSRTAGSADRTRLTCPSSLLFTVKRKSSSVSLSSGANLASPAHETTASRSMTSAKNLRIDAGSEMSILGAIFREARMTSCLFASSAAATAAPIVPVPPTTTTFICDPISKSSASARGDGSPVDFSWTISGPFETLRRFCHLGKASLSASAVDCAGPWGVVRRPPRRAYCRT
jgi:hypothetical protein